MHTSQWWVGGGVGGWDGAVGGGARREVLVYSVISMSSRRNSLPNGGTPVLSGLTTS